MANQMTRKVQLVSGQEGNPVIPETMSISANPGRGYPSDVDKLFSRFAKELTELRAQVKELQGGSTDDSSDADSGS